MAKRTSKSSSEEQYKTNIRITLRLNVSVKGRAILAGKASSTVSGKETRW